MSIIALNSTFPPIIHKRIQRILQQTQDSKKVQNKLNIRIKNKWVVIIGLKFSYNISRGTQNIAAFKIIGNQGLKRAIIYIPPAIEKPLSIPFNPPLSGSRIHIQIHLNTSKVPGIEDFLQQLDYSEPPVAADAIKVKMNFSKESFWHVVVGENYQISLPKPYPNRLLTATATDNQTKMKIIAFRLKGEKTGVSMSCLFDYIMVFFVLVFSLLGLYTHIYCQESYSWLCKYKEVYVLIAMTIVAGNFISYVFGSLVRRSNNN